MWKNVVESERLQMAYALFTLSTYGYKHILWEYVVLIAFLLQQRLLERDLMLR
jgi:hypothetical protein